MDECEQSARRKAPSTARCCFPRVRACPPVCAHACSGRSGGASRARRSGCDAYARSRVAPEVPTRLTSSTVASRCATGALLLPGGDSETIATRTAPVARPSEREIAGRGPAGPMDSGESESHGLSERSNPCPPVATHESPRRRALKAPLDDDDLRLPISELARHHTAASSRTRGGRSDREHDCGCRAEQPDSAAHGHWGSVAAVAFDRRAGVARDRRFVGRGGSVARTG
jgi:hypothetical protein